METTDAVGVATLSLPSAAESLRHVRRESVNMASESTEGNASGRGQPPCFCVYLFLSFIFKEVVY